MRVIKALVAIPFAIMLAIVFSLILFFVTLYEFSTVGYRRNEWPWEHLM